MFKPKEPSWHKLTFKQRFLSFAYRYKWYVTGKHCWAHNDTCEHCGKHNRCGLKRPGLICVNGTWCCGSYLWSLNKFFDHCLIGQKVVVRVARIETQQKEENNEHL